MSSRIGVRGHLRARAETERARAERLAAKLRALGVDPDDE